MKYVTPLMTLCLSAVCFTPAYALMRPAEPHADISQKAKPVTIKVAIAKQAEGALIEAKGRYHVYDPINCTLLTDGTSGKLSYLSSDSSGIKWGDLFEGVQQIRLVPGDSQSSLLVNGIQYKGCLDIYGIADTINIVNEVDVETYLKTTLPDQLSHEMTGEALHALVIAARTNAYNLVARGSSAVWHVDAADVGYNGYAMAMRNNVLDRAIDTTEHVVLTYKSQPFAATWNENSAGKTASFASIFRKAAVAPMGVVAPLAAHDREAHRWSLVVSKTELAKAAGLKGVNSIDLYLDQNTAKVYGLRISHGVATKDLDFFKLQKALGKKRLLSNDFTVELKGDQVLFSGYGEGHGVGLCLYSAEKMAERGESAAKILTSFYPEAKLQKMRTLTETQN